MDLLDVLAVLITTTAVLAFVNHRYVGLPASIGAVAGALLISFVFVILARVGVGVSAAIDIVGSYDFNRVVMNGMLSFLLFAGALQINQRDLAAERGLIVYLATAGVLVATLLTGLSLWWVLGLFGFDLPLAFALVFGALISPTDPVAVLDLLKRAGAPKRVSDIVAGESLFNDPVAIVVFTALLGLTLPGAEFHPGTMVGQVLWQGGGGIALGVGLGWCAGWAIERSTDVVVRVMLTLALVLGGYELASVIGVSGPLSTVMAALVVSRAVTPPEGAESGELRLTEFWGIVDQVLNAVLFVMIGLEILLLRFRAPFLVAGLLAVPLVLAARWFSIALPSLVVPKRSTLPPHTVTLMTWCGLRGGVSIALALSLTDSPQRDLVVVMTYVVALLSLLGQGLTVGPFIRWTQPPDLFAESRKTS